MGKSHRLSLEHLEERCVPAILGVPWTDPRHLTLSFVPDATPIAAHTSNLFSTLDSQMPRLQWETAILRAIQTWVGYANIDVGVVSDSGLPFGTPGLTQGDPRFGDIRIGAQAMSPEAISVSVPHDPYLSGTWSGDVLLNSTYNFADPNYDLYTVALHEFGHVFGLGDSTDPMSVMFPRLTFPHQDLAPSDITNIRALYGSRASDLVHNSTLPNATPISYPDEDGGYKGTTPLIVFADLSRRSDIDVYSVATLPNYQGSLTFRVVTSGVSLLEPMVTVYDANGNVIGTSASTAIMGDVVTVTVPQVALNATYYVKVQAATKNAFALGRYGIAVTFDANLTVPTDSIDAVLRGPYDSITNTNVDEIFTDDTGVLFNDNGNTSSTPGTAQLLVTTAGYSRSTHYNFVGSLGEDTAVNYYRVQAPGNPAAPPVVITVALNEMSVHGTLPQLDIFDSQQHLIATGVLVNGNDTFVVQATGLTPGAVYYLRVSSRGSGGEDDGTGNYSLDVDFSLPTQLFTNFGNGTLTDATPTLSGPLYVADSQLFEFSLYANPLGTSGTASVRMRVFDSSGNTLFDLSATAGATATTTGLFLTPGAYTIEFDLVTSGPLGVPLSFQLGGATLSDPIGPAVNDPTLNPLYRCPTNPTMYCYPNGSMTSIPYLISFS